MRTHPRHCKPNEQPCKDEHTYNCASCAKQFICDVETHYKVLSGVVVPGKFWPAGSLRCYVSLFGKSADSNPNGVSWNDTHIEPPYGDDPMEPIDFGDPEVARWLADSDLDRDIQEMAEAGMLDPDPMNDQARESINRGAE